MVSTRSPLAKSQICVQREINVTKLNKMLMFFIYSAQTLCAFNAWKAGSQAMVREAQSAITLRLIDTPKKGLPAGYNGVSSLECQQSNYLYNRVCKDSEGPTV